MESCPCLPPCLPWRWAAWGCHRLCPLPLEGRGFLAGADRPGGAWETLAVNGQSCFTSALVSRQTGQAAAVILQPRCPSPAHFPCQAGLPSLQGREDAPAPAVGNS